MNWSGEMRVKCKWNASGIVSWTHCIEGLIWINNNKKTFWRPFKSIGFVWNFLSYLLVVRGSLKKWRHFKKERKAWNVSINLQLVVKVSSNQLELHSHTNKNLYQALSYHIVQRQDGTCYLVQIQSSDWLDQTLLRSPPWQLHPTQPLMVWHQYWGNETRWGEM